MLDLTPITDFARWGLISYSLFLAMLGTRLGRIFRPPVPRQIFYVAGAGGLIWASLL